MMQESLNSTTSGDGSKASRSVLGLLCVVAAAALVQAGITWGIYTAENLQADVLAPDTNAMGYCLVGSQYDDFGKLVNKGLSMGCRLQNGNVEMVCGGAGGCDAYQSMMCPLSLVTKQPDGTYATMCSFVAD